MFAAGGNGGGEAGPDQGLQNPEDDLQHGGSQRRPIDDLKGVKCSGAGPRAPFGVGCGLWGRGRIQQEIVQEEGREDTAGGGESDVKGGVVRGECGGRKGGGGG